MEMLLYSAHLVGAWLLGARNLLSHLEGAESGEGNENRGSATLARSFERYVFDLVLEL